MPSSLKADELCFKQQSVSSKSKTKRRGIQFVRHIQNGKIEVIKIRLSGVRGSSIGCIVYILKLFSSTSWVNPKKPKQRNKKYNNVFAFFFPFLLKSVAH